MFQVTKTFGHDLGLSATFRQWRAKGSHCRFLHGYALAFEFTIGCERLDDRNWCFDFGEFQQIKHLLVSTFDHKLVIAQDDPERDTLRALQDHGCADVLILPAVGCEAFAAYVYHLAAPIIAKLTNNRAQLLSVTVKEHGANSATYR